tara:strand:- start:4075 stop:4302 length:228 start_codon:yes stop_codon:yes gene_type:complete
MNELEKLSVEVKNTRDAYIASRDIAYASTDACFDLDATRLYDANIEFYHASSAAYAIYHKALQKLVVYKSKLNNK